MSELPDRLPTTTVGQPVAPHHRPPNVVYDEWGRPHHVVLGQPSPPPVIVQMPEPSGLSPELQRLIIVTFLILAVVAVCTAAICAVVVICGGTLMGIIGAVGANSAQIMVALIGVIVAAGWALSKVKSKAKSK